MERVRAALLLSILLAAPALAGCATIPDAPGGIFSPIPQHNGMAYDGRGNPVAMPAAAPEAPRFGTTDVGNRGAEPTLGVDPEGRIFVISDKKVFRSDDQGASWKDVSPGAQNWPAGSLDPYLHVDTGTGRVFVDHLYVGCSYLLYSDDGGASWVGPNPAACGIPVNDHQTVGTGKPVGVATPMLLYPNVVYYAYNGLAYTGVSRSLDGGLTWAAGTVAVDSAHCGGLNGHVATAPDGTVYVPAAGCDEPVVAVSRDSGRTWEQHVIATGGLGRSAPGDDPSLAVDAEGNAHLVWPGKDARMYGSLSTDGGRTWSEPSRVSPPWITSSLFATSVAGGAGRVAYAYYGTRADTGAWASPNSGDAPDDTEWHLYVTYSHDALRGADATWITVRADDDPIQVGRIHNGGGGDPDRNLLDFFDLARDEEGRLYVAYTDGHTETSQRDRLTAVAVMLDGASLVDGRGLDVPAGWR